MRHINGQTLEKAEILHLKNNIRVASLKYFTDTIPEFMDTDNISAILKLQSKIFLEGQKFSPKTDRKTLDAGLKIWRTPSFQDYLQELLFSDDFGNGRQIRMEWKVVGSFERDHTDENENSASRRRIFSDNPAKHFLNYFDRIVSEGYIPTMEDFLCLRIPTTGNALLVWFI